MNTYIQQNLIIVIVLMMPSLLYSQWLDVPDGTDTSLVYQGQLAAIDTSNNWQYQKYTSYDLNGDGVEEKILVFCRVERSTTGEYSWDDGQPWEVRIDASDGSRTRVFARNVQLGTVQCYIVNRADKLALFILEQSSNYLRGSEIIYLGPNKIKSRVIYSRGIERSVK